MRSMYPRCVHAAPAPDCSESERLHEHGLRSEPAVSPSNSAVVRSTGLVSEFDGLRTPEEIRACTDAILTDYDEVAVRSFILPLAERRARACLRADVCEPALV